jgi:hypothetical protein
MSKVNVNIVVNSPAGAADLTRPGQGRVLVTGDSKGFLRPKVKSIKVKPFIVETRANIRVAATATPAVGTAYKFVIEQASAESQQNNQPKRYYFTVVSTSTVAATFAAQVTAAVQGLIDSGELDATVTAYTSGNGGVDILGAANAGLLSVIQPVNMTVTSLLTSATMGTGLTFSGLVATLTVAASSAYPIGSLIKVTTWTGGGLINGKTATEGVILRVASHPLATTLTAVALSQSGSFTGSGQVIQLVASEAEGKGSDLIAERGIVGQNADIVAATVYDEVVVDYLEPTGETQTKEEGSPILKSYFIDASTSAANALALRTQFEYVNGYLDSAGSVADPLLL